MKKAILATKVGMTQIFNDEGVLVPVTVLQAGPCVVTQVKTVENDGYAAVQVGFVDKKEKLLMLTRTARKKSETDMALIRLRKVILTRPAFLTRDPLRSSSLRMQLITQ